MHFPMAFLALQAAGSAEIELPEWLFDLDYPGHYMRRIKNVSLTIPAVVGPYTGVHCRLTLLSSSHPRRSSPSRRRSSAAASSATAGTAAAPVLWLPTGGNGRRAAAVRLGTPATTHSRPMPGSCGPTPRREAIATSSGQNDSGLFELDFRDERYLPFE